MNNSNGSKKDIYYTTDHEWIDYQGTVAYIGVCRFKLTGFKEIHQVSVQEPAGFVRRGEVIAIIKYHDYQVEAHMPVDGKLIKVNDSLVSGNPNILLQQAENSGWIAMIVPSQPYERKDLLLPKQYRMNEKR